MCGGGEIASALRGAALFGLACVAWFPIGPGLVGVSDGTQEASRTTRCDDKRRNIRCHYATGTNDRTGTDVNAWQHDGARSHPDVVANVYRIGELPSAPS